MCIVSNSVNLSELLYSYNGHSEAMDVPLVFYSSTTTFWTYSLHRKEEKTMTGLKLEKKKALYPRS